jgi:predicted RNase H-like nuclease (RuvC/YqgF family)
MELITTLTAATVAYLAIRWAFKLLRKATQDSISTPTEDLEEPGALVLEAYCVEQAVRHALECPAEECYDVAVEAIESLREMLLAEEDTLWHSNPGEDEEDQPHAHIA